MRVKPNARSESLLLGHDGPVNATASVKAPPVDGKANAALIALVARQFGTRRNSVTITGGASARIKRIEVRGATRWPPSLDPAGLPEGGVATRAMSENRGAGYLQL
ncbi:MAG: DUF167 domain-containing protein [Gammaproteobacteria bacterium]|nr:DUF167 domain-containing protein [Gammaproteobacteria bacterium]